MITSRNEAGIAHVLRMLQQEFGKRLQTNPSSCEQHGHTTTWLCNQPPDGVIYPHSTDEVAKIVTLCEHHSVPIIPYGTGTSLEGQVNAPVGGITIDLTHMNQILSVYPEDLQVVVQPGVTREQLNVYLREQGLFFPVDPGADASLGGMTATRASGTNAVLYGTMKDNVIGLELVTAGGAIIRTANRAKKSAAGYDLTQLIVGSEGTLGVITEITLRLRGIPEAVASAVWMFPSVSAACEVTIQAIQSGLRIARIELVDQLTVSAINAYSKLALPEMTSLLLEFHGTEAAVEEQQTSFREITEAFLGEKDSSTVGAEERNKLWKARHNAYWAIRALQPGTQAFVTDVCVPISRLAECVKAAHRRLNDMNLIGPIAGHVGDGNFHCALLFDPEDSDEQSRAEEFVGWLNELAISMDGTCTGEHGIGQGKIAYLEKELGPATDLMRSIKTALDPKQIFNPNKIFSQPVAQGEDGP
ncbi:MAG: FAD-binding protein [Aestuariivita sp.]|nr:FAD-binding protein [Aestuariivita sp.]MCY4347002.1 FAD-binding protein [Aestuariivita sp.]